MKKILSVLLSITLILIAAVAIGRASLDEEMEIYEKTLRLHIPANSDSKEDQEVKLKVRDAVLKLLKEPLSKCSTRDEAITVVQNMTNAISEEANKTLDAYGYDYLASVSVVREHYPEKTYGDITLPAGNYASLKIELGKADGQNWWCVLFPQVCVGSAKPSEALADVGFTANQIRILTEQEDYEYVVKFKLIEVISSLLP